MLCFYQTWCFCHAIGFQSDFNTRYLVLVNINAQVFANDNFISKYGQISLHSIVGYLTQPDLSLR